MTRQSPPLVRWHHIINDVISTNEMILVNAVMFIEKGEKAEERNTMPNMSVRLDRLEPIAFAAAR